MSRSVISRLRGRSTAELRDRARQAVARWLERGGWGDIGEPDGERLAGLLGTYADGSLSPPILPALRSREATLNVLRKVDPAFEQDLRARADRILAGRFTLLGHDAIALHAPVDWHTEPLTGIKVPRVHWSRIDFLDPSVVGDHKLVWEFSRHQHLVTLAQAWWSTRDARYADAVCANLTSWMDANPPKDGVHWASSLEIAFRAISWTWVLFLTADVMPVELRRRALGFLAVSGRHVSRYLSTWFSPNTHLTGEALGLFVLGTLLPGLRDAAAFREAGSRILLTWLDRHVRPDGTYVEQSTWYHRYTTDFYLHFLTLADATGLDVRDRLTGPLGGLLDVLAWVTRPDGTMPLVGDDDGGRLLFLDAGTAHQTRTPLAVGAALLDRADLAAVAGHPTPELVWLLGPDGLERFHRLSGSPPAGLARSFPDGGLYVIRSGWDPSAGHLSIDAGPHGFLNAGHTHADALSIDLTLDGHPLFVDPGTFTYTVSPEWRDHFRSGASHNAPTVDGCGAARVAGPFSWATRADAQCDAWFEDDGVVLFRGSVQAFGGLHPPLRVVRTLAFVAPDLWVIQDEVFGGGLHDLAAHWQCAPSVQARVDETGIVLRRAGLRDTHMRVAAADGRWLVEDGWVSPTYGVRVPAPLLRYTVHGPLPRSITTVVTTTPLHSVSERAGSDGVAVEIAWGERSGVLATAGGALPPWIRADAAVVWCEGSGRVVAAGVRRLAVSGRTVLDGDTEIAGIAVAGHGGLPDAPTGGSLTSS